MAHTTINGVTIPGEGDAFEETTDDVGATDTRGVNGALVSSSAGRKRDFSVSTVPVTAALGEALRALVCGEGHAWPFADSLWAHAGVGPSSTTGCTQSASGGKYAGKLAITSTNRFEVSLAKRMARKGGWNPTSHGWTVSVWKKLSVGDGGDGTTYHHHLATGSVAVVRGASANPAGVTQYRGGVVGAFAMGNWLSVSAAGVVAVHAYTNAGAGAAYDWSDLVVLPFQVPAAWTPDLYTWLSARAWSRLPRVELAGDCIPDLVPVEVRARVSSLKQRNVFLEGAHRNNARVLDIDLKEW